MRRKGAKLVKAAFSKKIALLEVEKGLTRFAHFKVERLVKNARFTQTKRRMQKKYALPQISLCV